MVIVLTDTIMSGGNAFRSGNGGKKVERGLDREHQEGGTIGPARIRCVNVQETIESRHVASIAAGPSARRSTRWLRRRQTGDQLSARAPGRHAVGLTSRTTPHRLVTATQALHFPPDC
jgi:hypothetical protein